MELPFAAIPGILQAGGGLIQGIFGGGARRKAQKELEGMVNNYQPNASIMDYYNKALSKYSSNINSNKTNFNHLDFLSFC